MKRWHINLSGFILLAAAFVWVSICTELFKQHPDSTKSYFRNSKTLQAHLFKQKQKNKYKFKTDKPDKAMEEEIAIRSEIGKSYAYKPGWRFKAMKIARQYPVNAVESSQALNWIEHGPGNVGGRTRAIAVHPDDEDIWWVGAVGGGVWKTEDAGLSWQSLTEDLPVLSFCAIDICTTQPSILYAGTGEGFYNGDAIIGDGIFKTTDGGDNWTHLSSTASNNNFRYVNRIIVDPDNPNLVLAATNSGLYRSVDGGDSWTEVFNNGNRVQQIIANPLNFGTQFIAVNSSGIYKSTDTGITWSYVSEEIQDHNRIEMAIAEADTSILYASPVNSNYGLLDFFKSQDAGESWYALNSSSNWLGGQGWYDNTLVVSPLDADIVFAGGIDLYRVTVSSFGMDEQKISNWYSGAGYPYVHADQHFLVTIHETTDNFHIIAANDGGIHYSDDKGDNWQELNNYYNVTQYYDADRNPTQNQYVGGTQDNGTHRSPLDPDYTTSWERVIGGDGFDCAWNKTDPDIVYGTLYNTRIYKSTDGGLNFYEVNNGMPQSGIFHTPLAMDPENSDKLFTAGDDNTLWYTTNAAASWSDVYANYGGYSRVKINVSKTNSDIVWTGSTTIYNNVSTDGGLSFTQANQPSGSPHAYLTGIDTHPTQDSTAFITIGSSGSGKIYRTENLGQTWDNLNNNLPDVPVHTVLVMPFDVNEIWIGTDIGLFISYDNGLNWQYADNGIPAVTIRRLKIVDQYIVAATHGRGIWSVYREELSQGPLLAPSLEPITVPNPNTNALKIHFSASSGYDSAEVYVNNEVIKTFYNVQAGLDTFAIYMTNPPEDVTAQVYGYRNADMEMSNEESNHIYEAVETLTENFDNFETTFFGDLKIIDTTGFSNPNLNSDHPYNDEQTSISYLGTPIVVKAGSVVRYNDVAIIESGEEGSVYPDENFWDYVTVEGSADGDNWDILVEPYDCRYDPQWESAYNNSDDGDESMYRLHEIDITTNYAIDEKIYIRFRLYADANTNGWGWAIDDVEADNAVSGLAIQNATPSEFELKNNYPNPFNPRTRISFTLDQAQLVTLTVYDIQGRIVKRLLNKQRMVNNRLHQVEWGGRNESGDPVASGNYFYLLQAGERTQIKKMILMR
ncbi:MAG: T9SS type A sorting domain-containing protein [Caldithrix sp.]|nr:T9SS type A sorting domain-containing protein [Caldithrix sp.]